MEPHSAEQRFFQQWGDPWFPHFVMHAWFITKVMLENFVDGLASCRPALRAVFVTLHPCALDVRQLIADDLRNRTGEEITSKAVAVALFVEVQFRDRVEQFGVACPANNGRVRA